MIDDPDLSNDPALRRRWEVIRRKLEENAESLLTQGGIITKVTPAGRVAMVIRWVVREAGSRPVHHSVYLGDDGRLVDLVRLQLDHYRALGKVPDEIAGYARLGATASFAVRRLAARPRGAKA